MKNKKTLFSIIAIVAIIFTLVACGGSIAGEYKYPGESISFTGNKVRFKSDYGDNMEGSYKVEGKIITAKFAEGKIMMDFEIMDSTTLWREGRAYKKVADRGGTAFNKR
jgi:hypothetical protein